MSFGDERNFATVYCSFFLFQAQLHFNLLRFFHEG